MAHICDKNIPCTKCEDYRYDDDNSRMACFAASDKQSTKEESEPKQIIIPIPHLGGNLIAYKTGDYDYPGICIAFEKDDGSYAHDLVVTEAPVNADGEINTYYYGDLNTDDWTDKHGVYVEDIPECSENE